MKVFEFASGASGVAAIFAAFLWWWSASIKSPEKITSGYGGTGGSMQELGDAIRKQSRLSAWAARFAALSAILQAVSSWLAFT